MRRCWCFWPRHLGRNHGEVSGLAGYTLSSAIDRRARELNQLDVGGFTWGVQGAVLRTAMGRRSAVDAAVVGAATPDHLDSGTCLRSRLGNCRAALSIDSAVRIDACSRLRSPVLARRSSEEPTTFRPRPTLARFRRRRQHFFSRVVGVRGHVRLQTTMLNDTSSGDFCDPFGFCQGTLQQVEFAAGAVVRF